MTMTCTINKLMTAISNYHPEYNLVNVDIFNAEETQYGWSADYGRITLIKNNKRKVLTPEDIWFLFDYEIPSHFNFPKNNSSRKIVRNKYITVSIENKQKEFKNKEGQLIQYYPSRTFVINDNHTIKEIQNLTRERYEQDLVLSDRRIAMLEEEREKAIEE